MATRRHLPRRCALLPSSSPASNVAFSPLSLHIALSLLATGTGGATRDQLAATLGRGDAPEGLHAISEQVLQLVLADGSGAGGPRATFADGIFLYASLKLKLAFEVVAVGKNRVERFIEKGSSPSSRAPGCEPSPSVEQLWQDEG